MTPASLGHRLRRPRPVRKEPNGLRDVIHHQAKDRANATAGQHIRRHLVSVDVPPASSALPSAPEGCTPEDWPDHIVAEELAKLDWVERSAVSLGTLETAEASQRAVWRKFADGVRRRVNERNGIHVSAGHARMPDDDEQRVRLSKWRADIEQKVLAELAATTTEVNDSALNPKALRLARVLENTPEERTRLHGLLRDACYVNGYIQRDGLSDFERTVASAFRKADEDGPVYPPDRDDFGSPVTGFAPGEEPKHPEPVTGQGGDDQGDDEATRPVYASQLLTRSDLRLLPEAEPLIDNVLDQGTTALLYGKWGTAKTFIALDWAASVATGRSWQGRATERRRVLYVVGEGAFGFKGRTDAWERGWQTPIGDDWLSILPTPVNLMSAVDRVNLYAVVEWGGYGLVVLDTLARCMVGGDENSAKDSGIVVDALTKVQAATPGGRGVVLGVHHAGKDGKTLRGSSAFEGGADTVYFTSKDDAAIALTRQKRKDGPQHDHHLLQLDPFPGTNSCTLKAFRGETTGETTERTTALRLIVSQHFVSTGVSGAELRRMAVDERGMSRASYYRAVSDLVDSDYLTNTGTDKRPFYRVSP